MEFITKLRYKVVCGMCHKEVQTNDLEVLRSGNSHILWGDLGKDVSNRRRKQTVSKESVELA